MPPKAKGAKKPKKEVDPNALTEVDRTFYELQITDLNRKLARLRSLTTELEQKNTELLEANVKLDEDRADIIAYLKRTLQEKTDEINELQERLKSLQEKRVEETEVYEAKIIELEQVFVQMKEQLTSEIKLLNGKLNALEEFRLQREDLMKKFEEQETAMQEQEVRHKREIYSIERKFIIGKDKLKKEMEARLLQLSTDFQDVTDLRVAATTHRVIRENIAINNELNTMMETQKRLQAESDKLKSRDKTLRMQANLHEVEKKKALHKVKTQLGVIENLTNEHVKLTKDLQDYTSIEQNFRALNKDFEKTKSDLAMAEHKIRVLEQNLHSNRCERSRIEFALQNSETSVKNLNQIIAGAVYYIKTSDDLKNFEVYDKILNLLVSVSDTGIRTDSTESIGSCTEIYKMGDLGFIPKKVELRSKFPVRRHADTQTGGSFEDFIALQEVDIFEIKEAVEESEEYEEQSHVTVEEEESQVFFSGELSSEEDGRRFESFVDELKPVDDLQEEEEEEGSEEEEEEEDENKDEQDL